MRRYQTIRGTDWIFVVLKVLLSLAIDGLDIAIRLIVISISWGLSLAIPDPVGVVLNFIQVFLAGIMWGKVDALLQMGETVLEFIPVAGKIIDFCPMLTVGAIMYLFGTVPPEQVLVMQLARAGQTSPESLSRISHDPTQALAYLQLAMTQRRRSRAQIWQLIITLVICVGGAFVLWHFKITDWVTASLLGLALWAAVSFLYQIDWAQIRRPAQRTIVRAGLAAVAISLIPVAYYLWRDPEVLRPRAWEQMVADGMSVHFPGAEERAKELEQAAARAKEVAHNVGANKVRDMTNEFLSLFTEKEIKRREEPVDAEAVQQSAAITALQDQGLEIRTALDLERYRGITTLKVAQKLQEKRMYGWLAIGGAITVIWLLVLFWPPLARIPLKPDSRHPAILSPPRSFMDLPPQESRTQIPSDNPSKGQLPE